MGDYDWESMGWLMHADQGFKNYMFGRNRKSAEWMSKPSSMEVIERQMPTLVQSGVGIWVGGIGPMNSVKTLSNFGSAAPTFEAAENLVPKKSVVMW